MNMQQLSANRAEDSGNLKENPQYFETVIIGTGFSGLLAAIGLLQKSAISLKHSMHET